MTGRAALAAVCTAVVALVVATAAALAAQPSPAPGTIGLRLTPAPLRLDEGARTISAVNLSPDLALSVTLVTDPPTYVVAPTVFDLLPGAAQVVTLTSIDASQDGSLSVTATTGVTGTVRSAISLKTRLLHQSAVDRLVAQAGPYLPVVAILAGLASLLALYALKRRTRNA
jgi:hypothetical protein